MPFRATTILTAAALAGALYGVGTAGAYAASNTIGFEYDFEVDANPNSATNGDHKNNVYQLSYSHSFDSNFILGASAQLSNNIIGDTTTDQVEATAGYKAVLNKFLSVTGSVGIGERIDDTTYGDFPYWVIRASADLAITKQLTWQLLFLRWRDSFDSAIAFNTPQFGTQFSYKVSDSSTIYAKAYESFKNGNADVNGIGVGYRYSWK